MTSSLRQVLGHLDEAMQSIELRGEVGPMCELLVEGVLEGLAREDLDARSAAAMAHRIRSLIHPAAGGDLAALDELWAHARVLRDRLACRIALHQTAYASPA